MQIQIISKQKIVIITVLAIATAAIYAAERKWHFLKLHKTPAAQVAPVQTVQTDDAGESEAAEASGTGSSEIREILSASLFGQEEEEKKALSQPPETVLKTRQPVELRGIVYLAYRPDQSVASIAATGGAASPYKVGDELSFLKGWRVSLILPESVRIKQEGTEIEELLELPNKEIVLNDPNPVLASPAGQANNPVASPLGTPEESMPMPEPNQEEATVNAEAPPENMPVEDPALVQDPSQDNPIPEQPDEAMQQNMEQSNPEPVVDQPQPVQESQ